MQNPQSSSALVPSDGQGKLASDLEHYSRIQSWSGPLLVIATILALAVVNTGFGAHYARLLDAQLVVTLEGFGVAKPLLLWINDGLMALFFLVIALEIKHEAHEGSLRKLSQVVLPGIAALGGIAVPALLYYWTTRHDPIAVHGWAIPCATDIAFSLAVLGLFGTRLPRALKAFLMTLAVFDDIGAILIIAVFYTEKVSWSAHGIALVATLILFALNRKRVESLLPYGVVGTILWLAVLKSGVHATIAGVIIGLAVPYSTPNPSDPGRAELSPTKRLEHALHPWVALGILPIFAFANAGVSLRGLSLETFQEPTTLGILIGLVCGKVIGIFSLAWLVIATGLAKRPEGVTNSALLGTSAIAGIGFTMSMFIGTLAFEDQLHRTDSMRLGVLTGSTIAAVLGILILHWALPPKVSSARRTVE